MDRALSETIREIVNGMYTHYNGKSKARAESVQISYDTKPWEQTVAFIAF